MVGKWIVYQSVFRGRYIARLVVGETKQFWVIERPLSPAALELNEIPETVRRKKSSLGKCWAFTDKEDAERTAAYLTDALRELNAQTQSKRLLIFQRADEMTEEAS